MVRTLIQLGYQDRPLRLVFAGDEETLHRHSQTHELLLKQLKDGAMMLNYEPSQTFEEVCVARKGGAIVKLKPQGITAHSGSGAHVGRSAVWGSSERGPIHWKNPQIFRASSPACFFRR